MNVLQTMNQPDKGALAPVRVGLLLIAWLAAIAQIILGDKALIIANAGTFCLAAFFILALPMLKRDSIIILTLLAVIGGFLLGEIPSAEFALAAGRFVLIFVALLAAMTLSKTTAATMPSVKKTQQKLALLTPETSSAGLQIAGHVFGGIINTGAFAMLSAALPPESSPKRRKLAAEAALRGMVTSAAWSPFFVAFAVGERFVGTKYAWIAMACGFITATLFTLTSIALFSPKFNRRTIALSLRCLRPVSLRLSVVMATVLGLAFAFKLTALSAVAIAMPMLVILQFARQPQNIRSIINTTHVGLKGISDDLMMISAAMIIGFIALNTDGLERLGMIGDHISYPGWIALTGTPVVMMLVSLVGIHPVITSTVMLALFSGGSTDVHPALLMQSHLIGWGAGTMSSVASLSVISCARLYRIPAAQLALGANAPVAFFFALTGGVILSAINTLII